MNPPVHTRNAASLQIADAPSLEVASESDHLWSDRRYKVSVLDRGGSDDGWQNRALTLAQIVQSLRDGHVCCAQLSGSRKATDFVCTDVLAIDIANERAASDLMQDPLIDQCASVIQSISTSGSATRLRLLFALPSTIESREDATAASIALALRLSGNPASADVVRSLTSSEADRIEVFDRGIPSKLLQELIMQGRPLAARQHLPNPVGSYRSEIRMPASTLIFPADGGARSLKDLAKGAQVRCPKHWDPYGSAFVTESQVAIKGIHCPVCSQTYWPEPQDDGFDFDSFDDSVRSMAHGAIEPARSGPLDDWFEGPTAYFDKVANVSLRDERFLGPISARSGAVFVKSPKGTGKTEALKAIASDPNVTILLVGHRRALIRSLCQRLGLNYYLDRDDDHGGADFNSRLGICLDSLLSIPNGTHYDIIIIDESEQVLAHFLSDTLDGKRYAILARLRGLISEAKLVVALDADLGWTTLGFITDCRIDSSPPPANQATRAEVALPPKAATQVILNEWTREQGELQLFASKSQIVANLMAALARGERCYVTSNSKTMIDRLQNMVTEEICPKDKILKITSETSNAGDPEIKAFLEAPAQEALKYRLILSSPSISSGVDLSFPDDEAVFAVYGIFDPLILTHLDCDQQLGRVRNPVSLNAYVAGRKFTFETNLDVIRRDISTARMMDHLVVDWSPKGPVFSTRDDQLLGLAAMIHSQQRASKNNLKRNFVEHKRRQGWNIVDVPPDDEQEEIGRRLIRLAKTLTQSQFEKALLEAPVIDDQRQKEIAERLDEGAVVTQSEFMAYSRFLMERFYGETITRDIIRKDDRGRFRRSARRFELATTFDPFSRDRITQRLQKHFASDEHAVLRQDEARTVFILKALEEAGLYADSRFKALTRISMYDLGGFTHFLFRHRAVFECQLDKPLPKDLASKPMRTVRAFLKEFGLTLEPAGTKKVSGDKIRHYRISRDSLAEMNRWAEWIVHLRSEREAQEHDDGSGDDFFADLMREQSRDTLARLESMGAESVAPASPLEAPGDK